MTMIRALLVTCGLLVCGAQAGAGEVITMYGGEIKILRLDPIKRVAVAKSDVVSYTLLKNGQLLLLAETEGQTDVHLWFEDERERVLTIEVTDQYIAKDARTLREVLKEIEGVEIREVGDQILLSGAIHPDVSPLVKKLTESAPGVINLTEDLDIVLRRVLDYSGIEGVEVAAIDRFIVLRGDLDPADEEPLETITEKFGEVLNLTTSGSLPQDKMVLMNVKFTEFNKSKLQNLGIDWSNPIAGPSAAFAYDAVGNEVFRPQIEDNQVSYSDDLPLDVTKPLGYFGIATEISSRINFLVNSGDALILAEPRLSTRSGGEATFLAGGEIPLPTTGSLGQSNVEFKEFGISLTVKPLVDRRDNILATVETEISAVDSSVAVDGIPGFITRRTSTDVSMSAGETLVISGLLRQETAKDINKLKFFGELPVLGALFRSTNFRNQNNELVIFLTPTVYDAGSEVNQAYIRRSREKLDGWAEEIDEKDLEILD
jgi:pilus assembly protein CpaC